MRTRTIALIAFAAGLGLAPLTPAAAQTGYPMIKSAYPTGGQRGQKVTVKIRGHYNLYGASQVFFEGRGLQATVNPIPKPKKLKPGQQPSVNDVTLTVNIAPDAPLGPQEFRIMTPRGISSVGQFVVGDLPEQMEKEPNEKPEQAMAVSAPVTLNGQISRTEDMDTYKFTARAGEQMAFSCLSARLMDKIHDLRPGSGGPHSDLMLTLLDAQGRELASNDDYYHQDPLLLYTFKQGGVHYLQIRDVNYAGSPEWSYRLTVTNRPYLTGIFPMAGRRGSQVPVQPVGANVAAMGQPMIAVPAKMNASEMTVQIAGPNGASNPMPFIVSDDPQVMETPTSDSPDTAQAVTLPAGINGRIEKPNDADYYAFPAVKGRIYTFEVFSRRYLTSLDSDIAVVNADGRQMAANDDAVGKDSRLDWQAPADGTYALRIRDLHRRGGPTYIYYLAAHEAHPDFTLVSDDDKALIGPGAGYAMYIKTKRRNGFTGAIQLHAEGMPAGVTATPGFIPPFMTEGIVIFHAAPDAKPEFSRIRIYGTATYQGSDGQSHPLTVDATPETEIYMPGSGRSPYAVNTHMVSVMAADQNDVTLKLSATQVSLKPGGSVTVEVEVTRSKAFAAAKKDVILDVYLRHLGRKYGNPLPPGVTLDEGASKTRIAPGQTKGKIVLKAAANAKLIEKLPIAVLGQVSINFVVKVSHASEPVFLTVAK